MRVLIVLGILYVALITGWVSDDARITLRQVWNFINGDGMTINVGTRVQAFSHPLWFLLLSGITFVTRELFLTVLMVSISLSVAAVCLLLAAEWKANRGQIVPLSPVLLLLFSIAFTDYMTSGLENPLSYFLVGLLIWLMATDKLLKNRCWLFIVLALLVLNRFDYAVLFMPLAALLVVITPRAGLRLLRDLWPGVLLLLLWFGFALIYFGAPFPNTYYAKLGAGFPLGEALANAATYFERTLQKDPISLGLIAGGVILSVLRLQPVLLALAAGQLLYMGFIAQAGGGFMEGRWFAVPVFLAAGQIVLALSPGNVLKVQLFTALATPRTKKSPRPPQIPTSGLTVVLLLLAALLGWSRQYPFMSTRDEHNMTIVEGITDERRHYYQEFGLLSRSRTSWPQIVDQPEAFPSTYKIEGDGLGRESWSGPPHYLIDDFALGDPLIARLPAIRDPNWRTGHAFRKIPTDYGDFALGKIEQLPDESIRELANDVKLATTGDLFRTERFAAIWRLNTGYYSDLELSKYSDLTTHIPYTSQ